MDLWSTIFLINGVFFAVICGVVGSKKGNPFGGAFIGFFLGILGLIIVVLSSDRNRHPCPFCSESILKTAKVCPNCQRDLNRKSYTPQIQPTVQKKSNVDTKEVESKEEIEFDKTWTFLIAYDENVQIAQRQVEPYGNDALNDLKTAYKEYRDVAKLQEVAKKIAATYESINKAQEHAKSIVSKNPDEAAKSLGLEIVRKQKAGISICRGGKQVRWISNEEHLIPYLETLLQKESGQKKETS